MESLSPETPCRKDGTKGCCSGCKETCSIFTKHVLLKSLGFSIYVFDILSDANAAYFDYKAGDTIFAFVTLGLVFAPGTLFSFYLFCEYIVMYIGEIACLKAFAWVIMSPFMPLWVVLRDIRLIMAGILATCCPSRRAAFKEKSSEPSRVYLIKFLEAFTEAAPQLLVRLFRVASRSTMQFSDLRTSEIIQISFSLLTLSMKVVSTHQKSISTQYVLDGFVEVESKYSLPWYLQISALLWWICFLLTRFEALALFSNSYGYWVLVVIGIHVMITFLLQTIADSRDRLKRIFIYLFGAFVFIFAYIQFNLKTRMKIAVWFPYTVFATLIFVENSIMLTFWFFDQQQTLISLTQNSSYEFSTASSVLMNETVTTADVEQLNAHLKYLLYFHYGIFSLGIVFMIFVFCASSCGSNENVEESKGEGRNKNNSEMQDLMSY